MAGRESLGDIKLELELVARHNAGAARGHIEKILTAYEKEIAWQISQALQHEYSSWRMPFAPLLEHFEGWLGDALKLHLSRISATREQDFRQAVRDVQRQYLKILQGFRDRLSSRAMELLGVPLRTTETEIAPRPPGPPDVKIGRIFDHNWEFLSPVVPMPLVAGAVKARFQKIIAYETFKSLSRVTTQWSGSVAATIMDMQSEAFSRLEQLIQTVERLTAHSADRRAEIASDLERVRQAQNSISNQEHRSISD